MDSLEEEISGEYHKGKHDRIVKQLEQRLQDSRLYDTVRHNMEYCNEYRGKYGKVDVIARGGSRYLAFEVKSSIRHYRKAYKQLDWMGHFIKDHYTRDCNVYKFFVYGVGKNDSFKIKMSW